MKKQKKDKRRQSTQDLLGVKKITDYCIATDAGDLVFMSSSPQTSAFLPAGAVSAKIRALQNTLSAQAGVELLAMNSRESSMQPVCSITTECRRKRILQFGAFSNRIARFWMKSRCR